MNTANTFLFAPAGTKNQASKAFTLVELDNSSNQVSEHASDFEGFAALFSQHRDKLGFQEEIAEDGNQAKIATLDGKHLPSSIRSLNELDETLTARQLINHDDFENLTKSETSDTRTTQDDISQHSAVSVPLVHGFRSAPTDSVEETPILLASFDTAEPDSDPSHTWRNSEPGTDHADQSSGNLERLIPSQAHKLDVHRDNFIQTSERIETTLDPKSNPRVSTHLPLAGSLGRPSEPGKLDSQLAMQIDDTAMTESKDSLNRGNSDLFIGKSLSRNLFFLESGEADVTRKQFDASLARQDDRLAGTTVNSITADFHALNDAESETGIIGYRPAGAAEQTAMSRQTAFTDSALPTQFILKSSIGSHDWNIQMSDRIRWMSTEKMTSAELVLHPAELGTVEIRVTTEDDQIKVSFLANNQTARDLIENSLPKLREMMNDSGLQLKQSDVSEHNQHNQQMADRSKVNSAEQADFETTETITNSVIRKPHTGYVDHYV